MRILEMGPEFYLEVLYFIAIISVSVVMQTVYGIEKYQYWVPLSILIGIVLRYLVYEISWALRY